MSGASAEFFIVISLVANIAVLIPVSLSLLANARWCAVAYGPASSARGILLSIYLAILLGSLALLALPEKRMVLALLALQVAYKITTPFTAGSWANPVVVSNLMIAGLHAVTITAMFTAGLG
jgi:hypothetical protein